MTFFRPPVRRIEIGMLMTMVRPSRLSFGRSTSPTEMVMGFIIRRPAGIQLVPSADLRAAAKFVHCAWVNAAAYSR
jgi:hypothetical protein